MSDKKKPTGRELYKRDEDNMLENVDYVYNKDGSVDWRAMIPQEFLYIRKEWFEKFGKPIPDSPEGLKDSQLAIMLGGIKYLAKIRGFESVKFDTKKEGTNYVTSKCSIEWLPNYETDHRRVMFEDYANATGDNVNGFGLKFLEAIACNRAFVRCVRNFLGIHIVGVDELDSSEEKNEPAPAKATNDSFGPSAKLQELVADKFGDDFESFKETTLREWWKNETYQNKDAKNWKSFEDIPAAEARKLIKLVKST